MTDYICPFCGKTYSGDMEARLDAQIHFFLSPCANFTLGPHYLDAPFSGAEGFLSGARDIILPNTHEYWYSLLIGCENTKEGKRKLRDFMNDVIKVSLDYSRWDGREGFRRWMASHFVEPFKTNFENGIYDPNEKYIELLQKQSKRHEREYKKAIREWKKSQL